MSTSIPTTGTVVVAYHGAKDVPEGMLPIFPAWEWPLRQERRSRRIRDGIRLCIEELREDGLPSPEPITTAERISVDA